MSYSPPNFVQQPIAREGLALSSHGLGKIVLAVLHTCDMKPSRNLIQVLRKRFSLSCIQTV